MVEKTCRKLQQDLWLCVAAHGAKDREELPRTCGEGGRQRVWGASPGTELSRMAFNEGEAETPVVQVDSR